MNQNPPPRGPDNPFYGTERRDNPGLDPLNPGPTQNQQGHYPAPPQGGHNPGGPAPWGHTPGPGSHTPGGGYPVPPATPGPAFTPGYGPAGPYPPYPGYGINPHDTAVMSTRDWLLTLIILALPCVNIIMLFVWAFSNSGNHNRRNFCRAFLLGIAILIGIYFMFWVFAGAIFFNWTRWIW